ncbi:MAG: glycosyltransferase family 9 protein [Planctomycetota bacterium]
MSDAPTAPRILLVRLSALGDVLHTLPAVALLRRAMPQARLEWVVETPAADLLRGHPDLDRLWVFPRPALRNPRSRVAALTASAALARDLRRARFDAVLDLQGLLRSALVARLPRTPQRFGPGWAREGATWLYTDPLDLPRPGEAHAALRAALAVRGVAASFGVQLDTEALPPATLPLAPQAPGREVALLVGAGKPANRLPPELLAEVADGLAAAGRRAVLLGGPGDRFRAEAVLKRCERARPRVACGQSLPASAKELQRAAAVLGGDTGPLHLARILGRPVFAVFHAADPARTGPAGYRGAVDAPAPVWVGRVACAPCCASRCKLPGQPRTCLDALTAPALVRALLELCQE